MKTHFAPLFLLALLSVLALGCRSGQSSSGQPPHMDREYTLVLLRAGPGTAKLTSDERRDVQAGHMTRIQHLVQERHLLVAGTLGSNNPDPTLRGIFVFDTASPSDVGAWVASDPAVAKEVLVFEMQSMHTATDLVAISDRDLADQADRSAAGDTRMRSYVFALAEDGPRLERILQRDPGLLLSAQLSGGPAGFYLFDVADLDAARAWLGDRADRLGPVQLYPWFGSENLARAAR